MYTMSSAPDMEAMDPTLRLTMFENCRQGGKEGEERQPNEEDEWSYMIYTWNHAKCSYGCVHVKLCVCEIYT